MNLKKIFIGEQRIIWNVFPDNNIMQPETLDTDPIMEAQTKRADLSLSLLRSPQGNYLRAEEKISAGVYETEINLSDDLQRAIDTNVGNLEIPEYQNHYRGVLQQMMRKNTSAAIEKNPENPNSLEIDMQGASKSLQSLQMHNNPAVHDMITGNDMARNIATKRQNEAQTLKVLTSYLETNDRSIEQTFDGLYSDQTRTPLAKESEAIWKKLNFSEKPTKNSLLILTEDQIKTYLTKLDEQQITDTNLKEDFLYLFDLLLERIMLQRHADMIKNKNTQQETNIISLQQDIVGINRQIKTKEQELKFSKKDLPTAVEKTATQEQINTSIDRLQQKKERMQELYTSLQANSVSEQAKTQLGYSIKSAEGIQSKSIITPPKDDVFIQKSLDMSKSTYENAYAVLSTVNILNQNQKAMEILLEACMLANLSPMLVKDFFIKLNTYSIHNNAPTPTRIAAWISGTRETQTKTFTSEEQNTLQSITGWTHIEKALNTSMMNSNLDVFAKNYTIKENAQKNYSSTTGIENPFESVYLVWRTKYFSQKKLPLDTWFDDQEKYSPEVQNFIAQIKPADSPLSDKEFIRMTHAYISATHKTQTEMGKVEDNAEKTQKSMDKSTIEEGIKDKLSDLWDGIQNGDISSIAQSAIGIFFLYKLYKTKFGKNAMLLGGGAWFIDNFAKEYMGGSVFGQMYDYLLPDAEKQKTLANMVVSRNSKSLESLGLSTIGINKLERAGLAMGSFDAASMLNWYEKVHELKNVSKGSTEEIIKNAECMNLMPKNKDGKTPMDLMMAQYGPTTHNSEQKQKNSFDAIFHFMKLFFANVAEDQNPTGDNTKTTLSTENYDSLSIKGLEHVRNAHGLYQVQQNSETTMNDIMNAQISNEQKTMHMMKGSAAWADLKGLYGEASDEMVAAMNRYGIKNPVEYLKDFGDWAKKAGYSTLAFVNNEWVLGDMRGKAMVKIKQITKEATDIAKNGAAWTAEIYSDEIAPRAATAVESIASTGKQAITIMGTTFSDTVEAVQKFKNESFAYADEQLKAAQIKLAATINGISNIQLYNGDGSPKIIEITNQNTTTDNFINAITEMQLQDDIAATYGIPLDYVNIFIEVAIETSGYQEKFTGALQAIAKQRYDNQVSVGATNPVSEITRSDLLIYFFSGIYGLGEIIQGSIDITNSATNAIYNNPATIGAMGGAAIGGKIAGGTGALVGGGIGAVAGWWKAQGAQAVVAPYPPFNTFTMFWKDNIDGNSDFRTLIQQISYDTIHNTGEDSSDRGGDKFTLWSNEMVRDEAYQIWQEIYATMIPNTTNPPKTPIIDIYNLITLYIQQNFANEGFIRNSLGVAKTGTDIAGPSRENMKNKIKETLQREIEKIDTGWIIPTSTAP